MNQIAGIEGRFGLKGRMASWPRGWGLVPSRTYDRSTKHGLRYEGLSATQPQQGRDMSDKVSARTKALPVAKYIFLPTLAMCWAVGALAGDTSAEGKAILHKHCARCHSIEAVGESPLKAAPPMRNIYGRYATRELQEELLEGMVSRHKEMPQISFSEEDVAAILSYLYDLARIRQ